MTKSPIKQSFVCPKCGRLNAGFARCQTPGCGELWSELRGREAVVVEQFSHCVLSDALTDVKLPNGDYLWAPYFLDMLSNGMLDDEFAYTETWYAANPHIKRCDKNVA